MNKSTKWVLLGIATIVLIFFLVSIFGSRSASGIKVTAAEVKQCNIVETVSASGKIYPELEVKVGSGIAGEVLALYVKEGDSVTKGQMLAIIAAETTRAPRLNMNDYGSLLQGISAAPARSVSRVAVTAPISGIISMLSVKKGERVGVAQLTGSEFLRIADFSNMELRVDVNENDIIKVKVGDTADVEVDAYSKKKFIGIVSGIANNTARRDAPALMSNDATSYEVRIRLDKNSYKELIDTTSHSYPFRSGMNARAEIRTKTKKDVLCVPAAAVASRLKDSEESLADKKGRDDKAVEAQETSESLDELEEVVFVITEDGKVSRRVVTTGIQDMNNFEIVSGLKKGEKIVTGPYSAVSNSLRSGSKIKIVSKEELFEK